MLIFIALMLVGTPHFFSGDAAIHWMSSWPYFSSVINMAFFTGHDITILSCNEILTSIKILKYKNPQVYLKQTPRFLIPSGFSIFLISVIFPAASGFRYWIEISTNKTLSDFLMLRLFPGLEIDPDLANVGSIN